MKKMMFLSYLILGFLVQPGAGQLADCEEPGCFTRMILNVWKRFGRDPWFHADHLMNRLDTCFSRWSTPEVDLFNVSDSFWRGIMTFALQGGAMDGSDPWPGSQSERFFEDNPTPLLREQDLSSFPLLPSDVTNITIVEPCNTLSNTAYLRSILAVCDHERLNDWVLEPEAIQGLVESTLFLGTGSFFFHGSASRLGSRTDNTGIDLMALIAHQSSLQGIPYDPILYDLRETPANRSGVESLAYLRQTILNNPVDDWLQQLGLLEIIE